MPPNPAPLHTWTDEELAETLAEALEFITAATKLLQTPIEPDRRADLIRQLQDVRKLELTYRQEQLRRTGRFAGTF